MSTDTDPVEPWEDLADSLLDELMERVRIVKGTKETSPAFHAFMVGLMTAHLQIINRDLGDLGDLIVRDAARQP